MRACIRCGVEITACMGFSLARDMVAFWDGRNPNRIFREHCGKCVEIIDQMPNKREYLIGLGECYDPVVEVEVKIK